MSDVRDSSMVPDGEAPDEILLPEDISSLEELRAQCISALSAEDLRDLLRPIPVGIRQRLLSKIRVPGAKTPTVTQCRQIHAKLERMDPGNQENWLGILAIHPSHELGLRHQQLDDEYGEGEIPGATRLSAAITQLLDAGRSPNIVRIGGLDLAESDEDLRNAVLAHPGLALPGWPTREPDPLPEREGDLAPEGEAADDADGLDTGEISPGPPIAVADGPHPDGAEEDRWSPGELEQELADLRTLMSAAADVARRLAEELDNGVVPPLEDGDTIWDALYCGWDLLTTVREAVARSDESIPVAPAVDSMSKAIETLRSHNRLLVVFARLAAATGPERSSAALSELRQRARAALDAGTDNGDLAVLVQLIDAVRSEADDDIVNGLMSQAQNELDETLSVLIVPAVRGQIVLPPADHSLIADRPTPPPSPIKFTEEGPAGEVDAPGEVPEAPLEAADAGAREPEAAEEGPEADAEEPPAAEEQPETDAAEPVLAEEEANVVVEDVAGGVGGGAADVDSLDTAAVQTLARLIPDRRFGLAYWIARSAQLENLAAILAIAAYANATRSTSDHCAMTLAEEVAAFDVRRLGDDPHLHTLLLAAILRGSMLSASPLIPQRETFAFVSEFPNLSAVAEAFRNATYAGVKLLPGAVGAAGGAAVEKELAERAAQARQLFDDGPHRKIRSPRRATDIWRGWIAADGRLGRLLVAVADENTAERDWIREEVHELQSPKGLDRMLDSADRAQRHENAKAAPLVGVRATLLAWAGEVVSFVSDWLEQVDRLQALAPDGGRAASLAELRGIVGRHAESALAEITQWAEDANLDGVGVATVQAAAAMLAETFALLDGAPLHGRARSPRAVLGEELLLAPDVPLQDFRPLSVPPIASLLDAAGRTYEEAFDLRAAAGDHMATAPIVEIVRHDAPSRAEQLELRRADLVIAEESAVQDLKVVVERRVRQARRLGALDDDGFAWFADQLESVHVGERLDFGAVRDELHRIDEQLADRRREAQEGYLSNLPGILERHPEVQPIEARIRAIVEEQHDLATAEEWILLARLGVGESRKGPKDIPPIEEFFPAVPDALEGPIDQTAVQAVGAGGRWGPLDFGSLNDDALHRAEEALEAWWRLGAGAFNWKQIRLDPILAVLGIGSDGVREVRDLRSDRGWQWLDLVNVTRFGNAIVPAFGSKSGDSIRLLLVAGGPSETKILDYVAKDETRTPTLVLYFGLLTIEQRRNLAELTRPKRRGHVVAVIDDAVIGTLAATGNEDFETTMRLLLPFVSLNPYTPFNNGEVPEEMFYGRKHESREVREPRGSSFVYGGRQLGKSALLFDAQRRFQDAAGDRVAVYVDLRAASVGAQRPAALPDAIWDLLATRLSAARIVPAGLAAGDDPRSLTDAIARWIRLGPERRLLLLLDESDGFLKADSEAPISAISTDRFPAVSLLKELSQETQHRFKVVFAGLHQVQRFQSIPNHPLLQLGMGNSIAIGPLSPPEARDLVTMPLEALGYRFEDDDLVDQILTQTAYQPSVLQLVCSALVDHLLSKVRTRSGPPYPITQNDVERAFDDKTMADEIRRRFLGTINLDDHYKVIAYSMAFGAAEGHTTLSEADTRELASGWWPAGFAGLPHDEFRSLLSEMAGLGILVQLDDCYRLRSSLVRRYLGTKDEIEDTLLAAESFVPSMQFDARTFRRALSTGPDRRSPLTDLQLSELCARRTQQRVLLGTAALEIGAVQRALRQAMKDVPDVRVSWVKAANFRSRLREDLPVSHRILAVDFSEMPSAGVDEVLAVLGEASRITDHTLTTIAVLGAESLQVWPDLLDPSAPETAPVMRLRRWDAVAVRMWAVNVDLPLQDDATRRALLEMTGGWPSLFSRAMAVLHELGGPVSRVVERVSEELEDPEAASAFVAAAGVAADADVRQIWDALLDLGEPTLAEELADLLADSIDRPALGIEVLRAMGALDEDDSGRLQAEPVLARAWHVALESGLP